MPQNITGGIVRPLKEIDAPHILAPADDLPDEPFGGVDRRVSCGIGVGSGLANLGHVQQPDVKVGRQDRVIQEFILVQHRVLIVPKPRQGIRDEMVQRLQRLGAGGGEPERL